MAKLDMRKALAGAVAPLDAKSTAGESATELHLVETAPEQVVDAVDETVLNTDETESVAIEGPAPAPVVEPAAPRRAVTRTTPATKPAARAIAAEPSSATAMGVNVEKALNDRLVAYRASTRLSYHQIMLDAVERTYPVLADLVAKALGREEAAAAPQVKLFERTFVPPPVPLEGKQDRVTHTIRITTSNRSMLDDIAAEVKAPSRNFMICVALDHYLPGS